MHPRPIMHFHHADTVAYYTPSKRASRPCSALTVRRRTCCPAIRICCFVAVRVCSAQCAHMCSWYLSNCNSVLIRHRQRYYCVHRCWTAADMATVCVALFSYDCRAWCNVYGLIPSILHTRLPLASISMIKCCLNINICIHKGLQFCWSPKLLFLAMIKPVSAKLFIFDAAELGEDNVVDVRAGS